MSVSTSVRPLVCMEQLCSHRPDFHEILYWNIFRKYVQKIQVSLKSDKNNGHLHEDRSTFFFIISRSILLTVRNTSDKFVQKIKAQVLCSIIFLCLENRAICEIMWNNAVEPGKPQMTKGRMRIACWNTQAYKHTLGICNTYCFSTATMVARTRLIVTL